MPGQSTGENFVKIVKNESWLVGFRVTSLLFGLSCTVIGSLLLILGNDMKTAMANMQRDLSALDRRYSEDRVLNADRIGRVEGQVGELKGSIDTHRSRLNDIDIDRRALWQRIFEMGRQPAKQSNQ